MKEYIALSPERKIKILFHVKEDIFIFIGPQKRFWLFFQSWCCLLASEHFDKALVATKLIEIKNMLETIEDEW